MQLSFLPERTQTGMPHVTIELHERHALEHIAQWEHDYVASEMQRIGAIKHASMDGSDVRLPRACYFAPNLTREAVGTAFLNIKGRLVRRVTAVFSAGPSFGFGLEESDSFSGLAPFKFTPFG